ncbi:DUF459 domain-containing protein [Collimonas sp. NPDC087041]|uniref:SGNH/GDSL hydrolase family protein n=1 Tax=Collimonas sp. NPDC087041 TaxID=3363960 RepID=UPI00381626AA
MTDSIRGLSGLIAVFVLVIAMLESGGLHNWAQHLELGPWRSIALPVAATLDTSLAPIGIDRVRQRALANLALLRSSDTPDTPTAAPAAPAVSAATPGTTTSAPNTAATSGIDSSTVPSSVDSSAHSSDNPRLIALVGDSMMAVGISPPLLSEMVEHPQLKALRAFRSGTGLSRPDVFDWIQQYPIMLNGRHPAVAIVAIGANDAQDVAVDGKVLAFGTEQWNTLYKMRLRTFLDMLTRDGTQVIWISLPPMQNPKFHARMSAINLLAQQVVSENSHASWWDITSLVGSPDGRFLEFAKTPDGKITRIRAADGIHFSDPGGSLLTPTLLQWIEPSAESATANLSPPTNPMSAP